MKKSGASDLWDVIIERYCSKEERKLINEMSEDDYSDLVFAFDDMLLEIENRIKRLGEGERLSLFYFGLMDKLEQLGNGEKK